MTYKSSKLGWQFLVYDRVHHVRMQHYKSLRVAVMICANMVNTHTHTHTHTHTDRQHLTRYTIGSVRI